MSTPKQMEQQQQVVKMKNSGMISYNGSPMIDDRDDSEMTRSALSAFRAKEEEIERKRKEVSDKVQAQLGRVEEETRRLAEIREKLETFIDPAGKEVTVVRKKIDLVNRELKPMGQTCQRKIFETRVLRKQPLYFYEEKEYKEALDAFNAKSKEKAQLVTKLMELITESEKLRMKKLEELSKHIEALH